MGAAGDPAKPRRVRGKQAADALGPQGGPAVAERPSDDEARVAPDAAVAADGETLWHFTGQESMHAFWAVDRLSPDDVAKLRSQGKGVPGRPESAAGNVVPPHESAAVAAASLDFNCELQDVHFMSLVVGALGPEKVNYSVQVSVPILTNSTELVKGEYLLLEAGKKAPPKKRAADWKSDAASAAQAAKKQASSKPAPKKKAGAKADSDFLSF